MGDLNLNFSTSGYESISDDIQMELRRIFSMPIIGNALMSVRADMVQNLKEHIQKDVYDAYEPRVYKRRSKNRMLGTPLIDVEAEGQSRLLGGVDSGNLRAFVSVDYYPSGNHKVKKWSDANENELIRRIETGQPPYKWRPNFDPIERPFWQNFVEEQVDAGAMLDSFLKAMALHGEPIKDDGSGVIRESQDGIY